MVVQIEIICVGNELLIGKTLNTNAHWLAKRVTSLGAAVRRVTVVSDEIDEVASIVREALKRKPRFIITTGGLGPTYDDITLAGIAKGLGRKLTVNEDALKMVKEKYEIFLKEGKIEKVELTPSRVKMATLPKGTVALHNRVGTAPGMLAPLGETLLIALPGVPPEMEAIFEESVASMIKEEAGKCAFFEKGIYVDGLMESSLAPLIDQAMQDNSYVYIKSHVYGESRLRAEGKGPHIELHFSTTAEYPTVAKKRLNRAVSQLSSLVRESGGRTRSRA